VIVRRLVIGLSVPILLATAACSGSDDSTPAKIVTLAAVKVTGPTSQAPKVRFTAPIAFAKTASKVVQPGPGTGPEVALSSLVTVKYVAINATDQNIFGSSWKTKSGSSTFYVNTVVKGFSDGIVGTHEGDRVLIGSEAQDAFGVTGNLPATVRPGDSVVFVVDIEKVFPVRTPPADVPVLTYDAAGNPAKFTADSKTLKKPTSLGVYPIVKGPGPKVKSGDTVSVEYFGQIYPDGKVFNGWTGQSFSATLGAGQVIKGWDQGLVGQRVGSRVVLVIPPDLGYGKKKQSGIPANSTLIFTVQIVSVN
jgi:FKBP-type peptidyl-prolyl cis-trans isomerase